MKVDINHKPIFGKDYRDAQLNRFIIAIRNKTFLTKKQRVDKANGVAIKYSKSQKQDMAIVSAVQKKINAMVGSFWILKTWDNYRVVPYGETLKWSLDYLFSYAICNGIDNMMALNFGRVIYMRDLVDPPQRPDAICCSSAGISDDRVQYAIEGDASGEAKFNKLKPVLKLLGESSLNLYLKPDKIRIDTITPSVDKHQTNSLTTYVCKQCGGTIAIKSGIKRLSGGRSFQQYKCSKCNGIQRDDNLICPQH